MKIIKCKINIKKTKVSAFVKNTPKSFLQKLKKFGMGDKYKSLFVDYNKAKKLTFIFALDEKNLTIKSIDQNLKIWHGLFNEEKLNLMQKQSSKNENFYNTNSSYFFREGGMSATVLYRYIITLSSTNGGIKITSEVFIASPHQVNEDPNFEHCDTYEISMDCIENKEEDLTYTSGIDQKYLKKIKNKINMKKAIAILNKAPKKNKKMFSRQIMQYTEDFQNGGQFDLVKVAKNLNEISYEFLNDNNSHTWIKQFQIYFNQFRHLYRIHRNIEEEPFEKIIEIMKIDREKVLKIYNE